MKSTLRLLGIVLLVLVLVAGLATFTVSAQGPTGTPTPTETPSGQSSPASAPPAVAASPNSDNPGIAGTLGKSLGAVPAGTAEWLEFNYATNGDQVPRPPVLIRLINGATNGLNFEVWAANDMQGNWWENHATGKGSIEAMPGTNCAASTNLPPTSDQAGEPTRNCQTNDRIWVGAFGAPGTYFIRIFSDTNTNPVAPQLIVSGPGIAECQSGQLPQVSTQLQGNQAQTTNGQGLSIVQCQNPTQDQLSALSTANSAQSPSSAAPAAPSVAPTSSAPSATPAATPTTAP